MAHLHLPSCTLLSLLLCLVSDCLQSGACKSALLLFCCDDCVQSPVLVFAFVYPSIDSWVVGTARSGTSGCRLPFSPLCRFFFLSVICFFLSICESSMPISRWMWYFPYPSSLGMFRSSHDGSSWNVKVWCSLLPRVGCVVTFFYDVVPQGSVLKIRKACVVGSAVQRICVPFS